MTADDAAVVARARALLAREGFTVIDEDLARPWGGFLVVSPGEVDRFIGTFFSGLDLIAADGADASLSPKILLVAPGRRLSWQRHHRRAEIWRVVDGPVGVSRSKDDAERSVQRLETGDVVRLELGVRHRLVGLERWGVVAEIWQHTDPSCPSDESDIVRLHDDYERA